MKKLFFAMLALVALASCSKDEVVQLNQDEIKFSVVAENTTKAANVYCPVNPMGSFNVWARVGTTDFIGGNTGDVVTKQSDNTWKSNVTRYWPAGDVEFYAVAGMTNNSIDWNPTEAVNSAVLVASFPYEVKSDVSAHEDVLFAYNKVNKTTSETVSLNFRHALSQIVFKATNKHPNLYIEIKEVQVNGLCSKATFRFPNLATGNNTNSGTGSNFGTHEGIINDVDENGAEWIGLSEIKTYTVSFNNAIPLAPVKSGATATPVNLTDIADDAEHKVTDKSNPFENAMLLLPQSLSKYGEALTNGGTGSFYFGIKCAIYNVSNPTFTTEQDGLIKFNIDTEKEIRLYPEKPATGTDPVYAYAYIPASISWEMGKKYTYTFVFGADSNGGLEPDPTDPTKPDPTDPVLTNINYNVTVDEFVPQTDTDVNWDVTPQSNSGSGSTGSN